jgi:integrase/recombinase XerD
MGLEPVETFTERTTVTNHFVRSWQYSWASAGRSARTMGEMLPFVERFAQTLDGPLQTATRADCEQFIASHPSPFRANYAWRSLRSFYAFLAEEDEIPASPMAKVRGPKVPLTDVTTATGDDVTRLLKSISPFRTFTARRDACIVSMLWATGLRRSELAALTMSDIDIDSQCIIVQRSKNGRSRRVPIDSRTVEHLLRYMSKREVHPALAKAPEALWLGTKGALGSDGIRLMIQRRRDAAGVNVSAHSFRRGLAARALGRGMSQASLMTIAGWETPVMCQRYTRSVAADVAEQEYRRLLG